MSSAGPTLLELVDTVQDDRIPASMLFRDHRARDPHPTEARLAHLFINMNRGILRDSGVSADVKYDGQDVIFCFKPNPMWELFHFCLQRRDKRFMG